MDVPREVDLCRTFSEMLHAKVGDVDAGGWEDPQLCSDYVKDICCYLQQLELQQRVSPLFLCGTELSGRMWAVLVDWLVEVHAGFQLLQETLYMCVAVIDRCLQIREMEWNILKELNFALGRPLPLHFLRRAAKVSQPSAETYLLAKYLMELTLVDYEMVHFNPWEIAAAALCLSGKVSSQRQWSSRLRFYPGCTEERLSLIMRHVAKNVVRINRNLTKHLAVKKKYSSARFRRISTTPQLNCCTIKELAACWLNESKQLM